MILLIGLLIGGVFGHHLADHDWKVRISRILAIDLRLRHAEGEIMFSDPGTKRLDDPCRAERDRLEGLRADLQRISH